VRRATCDAADKSAKCDDDRCEIENNFCAFGTVYGLCKTILTMLVESCVISL